MPLWRRPGLVLPVAATAVAASTVGAATADTNGSTRSAVHEQVDHHTTASAANTLWARGGAQQDDTSRSASRSSASRAASTVEAEAQAANRSRAKQRTSALASQSAAASSARKKAAASAKEARSEARKKAARAKKKAAKKAKEHQAEHADRSDSSSSTSRSGSRDTVSAAAGWTCPIAGCGGNYTSGFGGRWGRMHLGDDFATPIGTPLHSLHSGTVVAAGFYGGMGNRVEIDYGNGVTSVFAHMSSISAYVGQTVTAGQVVGYSGNTGHSTGPHLHLEIHQNGQPIDPAPWLRAHGIF